MPSVQYVGPSDAVELHTDSGRVTCDRDGDPITVPAALARELEATGDWKQVKTTTKEQAQ